MSLNHIENSTIFKSRKSKENLYKQKTELTSHFPLIDKKSPKSQTFIKSSSTIINNNDKNLSNLNKLIQNPEVIFNKN